MLQGCFEIFQYYVFSSFHKIHIKYNLVCLFLPIFIHSTLSKDYNLPCHSNKGSLQFSENVWRWVFTLLIGPLTACVAIMIELSIEEMTKFKYAR